MKHVIMFLAVEAAAIGVAILGMYAAFSTKCRNRMKEKCERAGCSARLTTISVNASSVISFLCAVFSFVIAVLMVTPN